MEREKGCGEACCLVNNYSMDVFCFRCLVLFRWYRCNSGDLSFLQYSITSAPRMENHLVCESIEYFLSKLLFLNMAVIKKNNYNT